MKTFVDNAGRTWIVTIHVTAVRRCRALCGVDLYGLVDEKFEALSKLLSDPCGIVDVLYCLCKEEADKLGVSDEDFGRAMGGDALGHAIDAFLEELTDFFPDPRVRAGLKKVLYASQLLRNRLVDLTMERIDNLDLDSEVTKLIGSSGNSQESSESIPDRLPFASSF